MKKPSALFCTGFLSLLIWAGIIMAFVFFFVSCTLTIAPDGSKAVTIDGQQFVRGLEILSTK